MQARYMDKSNTQLRAIWFIVIAIAALTSMDATVKVLRADLSAPLLAVIRNLFAIPVLIFLTWFSGKWRAFHIPQWGLLIFRGLAITGAQFSFFYSLAFLPLAVCLTIFSIAPMLITLMSWILLRERFGFFRALAVIIGFAAVLLVMRPGANVLHWSSILPFFAAFCYAWIVISMNWFDHDSNASAITLWGNVIALISGLILMLLVAGLREDPLNTLRLDHVPLLALLGFLGAVGALLMNLAFRYAEASLLAPFEYLSIAVAIVLDFWLFNILPDLITWIGINMIVFANLLLFWRERRVHLKEENTFLP